MNKGGESSTITIIIAIVLGLAVLIFLIFGFSSGWGTFWDKVTGGGAGQSNLDTIMSSCELACTQNNAASYCGDIRTVKFGDNVALGKLTTSKDGSVPKDVVAKSMMASCYSLANNRGSVTINGEKYVLADSNMLDFSKLAVKFNVVSCPAASCQ